MLSGYSVQYCISLWLPTNSLKANLPIQHWSFLDNLRNKKGNVPLWNREQLGHQGGQRSSEEGHAMVKNFVSRPLLTLGSGAGENKEFESLKYQSEYVFYVSWVVDYPPKNASIHSTIQKLDVILQVVCSGRVCRSCRQQWAAVDERTLSPPALPEPSRSQTPLLVRCLLCQDYCIGGARCK